ncbi:MAG: hypothetical protein WCF12_12825 [Propionicimonas sp.]
MSIEVWWPRIRRQSRAWLMDNNGDAVPEDIVNEIVRAGGEITGSYLSDEAVDWVEAVANGEDPDPPIVRDETR